MAVIPTIIIKGVTEPSGRKYILEKVETHNRGVTGNDTELHELLNQTRLVFYLSTTALLLQASLFLSVLPHTSPSE